MKIAEATDACLTPVLNGRPTQADVGQAFRMVELPASLPGDDQPWLLGYNRGGQWTIDSDGRYAPFPGRKVGGFGLSFVHEATTGRIITADRGELLALDHARGFLPLVRISNDPSSISLLRVERLDLTLAMPRGDVLRLRGDVAEPWAERAHLAGDGWRQAFDLPALRAILFLSGDGVLKLRRDDGGWLSLGHSDHDGHRDYVEKVLQSEGALTVLLQMRDTNGPTDRLLALTRQGRDGPFRMVEAGPYDNSGDNSGPQFLYAAATGEVLRFEQPAPGAAPMWSRLTRRGYEPVPGGVAPSRDGDFLQLSPVDLPRWRALVFATDQGLALYRNGRMRLIPGPALGGLGPLAKIVDLPVIGRTLVLSRHGLFELTSDDRIVRVEAPFSTGSLPEPEIFEDARRGAAIIHAREGLFTLDRRSIYHRIPGPPLGEPSYDEHVVTLAVSGDHLLKLDNALWLLVSPGSPRWAACRTRTGVTNSSPKLRDGAGSGR